MVHDRPLKWKRTPKRFDGVQNTGKRIDQMLPDFLKEITARTADPREAVFQEWFALIGAKMAPFTEPVSLERGVLTVKVKSSTLYNLLCQHEKLSLLRQLQKKFPIQDLLFKVG
ncbi:MAG: DUF721 domain-containing protein [Chlamydiia bacterium]|nr:DUF721 domain-containing protein [Chlamydiia bacterium]